MKMKEKVTFCISCFLKKLIKVKMSASRDCGVNREIKLKHPLRIVKVIRH